MSKRAVITGVGGQDGSYLAEYLLSLDYEVIGLARRSSVNNLSRIQHLLDEPGFQLKYCDIMYIDDLLSLHNKIGYVNEVYHLAAQSHVGLSFHMPQATYQSIVRSTDNMLFYTLQSPGAKLYHASSSEQFGSNPGTNGFQNETTEFIPQSPYAHAKLAAHNSLKDARSIYGPLFYNGILFNHESPRRGEGFVTRKITKYIGQLLSGNTNKKLQLGDITPKRDWGYAPDYVRAMHLLLQQDKIFDVVVATGETHSIEEFIDKAFSTFDLNYKDHIEINNPEFMRKNEVVYLCGDATVARNELGWQPSVTFNELVNIMVNADVKTQAAS